MMQSAFRPQAKAEDLNLGVTKTQGCHRLRDRDEIQLWPKISAPLVNMILYFFLSQKSNLSLDNKNFKLGEISL